MALDQSDVDVLISNLVMSLPGASRAGVLAVLGDTLKEFFSDSGAWQEDISFQAIAAQDTYNLVPLEDGQIIRLLGVWDDKLLPIPAFMREFRQVKLLHAPETTPATKWFARVEKTTVLPKSQDGLPIAPDWTLSVHGIHIMDGVLGRMMSQQDKSYSNSTMSTYHLKRFRTGIAAAKAAKDHANGKGNQDWSFPRSTCGSQRGGVSTAWPTRAF